MFVPVLVGGVWWWSTWPERTARRFVILIAAGDVQAARSMLAAAPEIVADDSASRNAKFDMWGVAERGEVQFNQPGFHPRSPIAWLVARGDFSVSAEKQKVRIYYGGFVARRGVVQPLNELEPSMLLMVYSIRHVDVEHVLAKMKSEFTPGLPMRIAADEEQNRLILAGPKEAHDEFAKFLRGVDQEPADFADAIEDVELTE